MASAEISKILESSVVEAPVPLAVDGIVLAESRIGLHQKCVVCADRPCLTSAQSGTCRFKLDFMVGAVDGVRLTAFGIASSGRSESRLHRSIAKTMKGRNFTPAQFQQFLSVVSSQIDLVKEARQEGGAEVLDYLHDVKKRVGDVYQCAENLIARETGAEYSKESFAAASKEAKDAYVAAKALRNSVKQLEIFYNPSAAAFGQKRRHPIYKIAERIAYIANATSSGRVVVRMEGRSWGEALLYDSFDLLPTALVENAVKYSCSNVVTVTVTENDRIVNFSVENIGPPIDGDEMERVFERGYRGRWAKDSWMGDGLGLYAAQEVAKAHGTLIRISSESVAKQTDGPPLAKNVFMFSLTRSDSVSIGVRPVRR